MQKSPARVNSRRVAARLAVSVMALAVAGLGWIVVWSAIAMQDEAAGLARVGVQTGGQVRALQALSTIHIELVAMEDAKVIAPQRMAAVREARATLPAALDEMAHGDIPQAAAVARQAKPLAVEFDAAVERYINDPLGDVLYKKDDDGGDDTTRDAMAAISDELELMLNGRDVSASQAVTGMLGNVTRSERTIRAIALVLVPLGLLGAAASAWLLTVLRRRADEQNRAERARLETVLTGLPSPVVVTDETDAVVLSNPAAVDLVGSVRALADLEVRDPDGAPFDLPGLVARAREDGRRSEAREVAITRADRTPGRATLEVVPLAERAGRVPGVVVALVDITAQRMYEEQLHYRAYHDGLTGLPNRTMLWQRIEAAVTNGVPYALLLIDLDGFKAVNDDLGHHVGDELLQGVASRLLVAGGESATVARLGGDEFAILLYDAGRTEAMSVMAAVRSCFADPFVLSCGPVPGNGSVGFALAEPGQTPDQVLQAADKQMYRSKRRGETAEIATR